MENANETYSFGHCIGYRIEAKMNKHTACKNYQTPADMAIWMDQLMLDKGEKGNLNENWKPIMLKINRTIIAI